MLLSQCLSRLPNDRPSGFSEVLDRLAKIRPDAPRSSSLPKSPTPKPQPPRAVPPPAKPQRATQPELEVLPISALGTAEPLPAAIPVYPTAIPTGRSSGRHPQVAPPPYAPPPLPQPPPLTPILAPPATRGPGIAVVLVGIVALLTNVVILFSGMVAMEEGNFGGAGDTVLWLLFGFCALASGVSIVSGVLMLNRKAYALALTGCFLAMLPIGICFIAGLPIGIWAMAVISRPEVRATFT